MFISKMKTLLSVCTVFVLFGLVHVEAVTDEEFQALFIRLSALEEQLVISDKRIGSLEKDIVSYEKRIADLETYRKLSHRTDALLKRKNEFLNRRIIALEKKLSDKTVAVHEKGKTPADSTTEPSGKNMTLSDKNLQTFEKNDVLPKDRSGQDEREVAAADKNIRSTAEHPVESRRFVAEGVIAFSAIKSATQNHMGMGQNIIFEQVLTNEGGGYHPNHGVFIAPQSGVYVMSSSVLTSANGLFHASIVHNGNVIVRIYGHGDSGLYDQGSQTIVIKLNAGDEVSVQNVEIVDVSIFGALYSSFSGYLLWPQ